MACKGTKLEEVAAQIQEAVLEEFLNLLWRSCTRLRQRAVRSTPAGLCLMPCNACFPEKRGDSLCLEEQVPMQGRFEIASFWSIAREHPEAG
ncbi:hypothetical protein DYE50_12035 [Treponema ruminis]|nr:hypothetical protein DYE50_12035 [Treponema ruminis]